MRPIGVTVFSPLDNVRTAMVPKVFESAERKLDDVRVQLGLYWTPNSEPAQRRSNFLACVVGLRSVHHIAERELVSYLRANGRKSEVPAAQAATKYPHADPLMKFLLDVRNRDLKEGVDPTEDMPGEMVIEYYTEDGGPFEHRIPTQIHIPNAPTECDGQPLEHSDPPGLVTAGIDYWSRWLTRVRAEFGV